VVSCCQKRACLREHPQGSQRHGRTARQPRRATNRSRRAPSLHRAPIAPLRPEDGSASCWFPTSSGRAWPSVNAVVRSGATHDGDEIDQPSIAHEVVHEMLTGPHPDLRRRFQFEMSQTIGLYEAAVAGATGEMGILGTEHEATCCGRTSPVPKSSRRSNRRI